MQFEQFEDENGRNIINIKIDREPIKKEESKPTPLPVADLPKEEVKVEEKKEEKKEEKREKKIVKEGKEKIIDEDDEFEEEQKQKPYILTAIAITIILLIVLIYSYMKGF